MMSSLVVAILILASLIVSGFAFAWLTSITSVKQGAKQSLIYLAIALLFQLTSWILFTGDHFQLSLARDTLFSVLTFFLIWQHIDISLKKIDKQILSNETSLYPIVFGVFVLFGLSKSFDVIPDYLHDTWLIIVSLVLIVSSVIYLKKTRIASANFDIKEDCFGFESNSLSFYLSSISAILLLGIISLFFIGNMKIGFDAVSGLLISLNPLVYSLIAILPFVIYVIFKKSSRDIASNNMVITDGLLLSVGVAFPVFLLISKYAFDKNYFIGFSDYQFWALFFSFLITSINVVRSPSYVGAVISAALISLLYVFNLFYM